MHDDRALSRYCHAIVIALTSLRVYDNKMTAPRNESLKLTLSDLPSGVRLMQLEGPLTISNLFDFQNAARNQRDKAVVVDITAVPYMDSAGLGCLISVFTSCQAANRGFGLFGISDRIKTLFEVTKVNGLLPSYGNLEDAERAASGK